ncbi:hypothetical protein [Streptomyces sp. NRRL WC-3742]|uniref:hypothetical protein n=1 Tax=Streptomyces sp. NRRL WC-3742 TaxID=1463934 RepID=UPI0004C72D69|nr:hypothetical protein [Streptomyces sp. NRRL WC-3742]
MADTVTSLASHLHGILVADLSNPVAAAIPGQGAFANLARSVLGAPQGMDVAAGFRDVIARASVLGPDAAWLVAAGHSGLSGLAFKAQQTDAMLYHLDQAVTYGFNDCLALHSPPMRAFHQDPRFRASYQRIRITLADLDEVTWAHRELLLMSRDASRAAVDNVGRRDTGISPLPQAPLPTRVPDTPGVLITRVELSAAQTALQRAAIKAETGRASGNVSLSLVSDDWDHAGARRDAWRADELETHRQQAAAGRAFVERPGVSTLVIPCPPLGSLAYPAG